MSRKRAVMAAGVSLLAALAVVGGSFADQVFLVDHDDDIPAVLAACLPGDRVVVDSDPEPYIGNFVVPPGVTFIGDPIPFFPKLRPKDAQQPVVTMHTDCEVDEKTVLNTFNIQEGKNHGVFVDGDGRAYVEVNEIFFNEAVDGAGLYYQGKGELHLRGNYFQHNTASNHGGGVFLSGSGVIEARDNRITLNTAAHRGGGVAVAGDMPCSFEREEWELNTADCGGGAAFWGSNDAAELSDVLLADNTARQKGGGIYLENSSPAISACEFRNNRSVQMGGGVCALGSSLLLSDSFFQGGSASAGAGVYLDRPQEDWPLIARNTFFSNSAQVMGGGICCLRASPWIENNVFNRNAARAGHGVLVDASAVAIIRNNTFAHRHNCGVKDITLPEAVRLLGADNRSLIINNLIAYHVYGVRGAPSPRSWVGYNDFFAVSQPLSGVADSGANNFQPSYPFAAAPANAAVGDLHLNANSSAVGAALRAWAPADDRDGQRRDGAPDRGAYEWFPN